jgi:hypothetical protein
MVTMFRRLLRHPATWLTVAVLAAFGLYWFQPWKLVTDSTVNEALTSTGASAPAATPAANPAASGSVPPTTPAGPRLTLRGTFVTHEHATTGEVRVVAHPDGRRQLEIVDLDTSNGPDLRVWLADQPVREGEAGWKVFDDGRWVELGRLKGNKGSQVYEIPAGTDLESLRSVTIWCKRFSVSFGAAALT